MGLCLFELGAGVGDVFGAVAGLEHLQFSLCRAVAAQAGLIAAVGAFEFQRGDFAGRLRPLPILLGEFEIGLGRLPVLSSLLLFLIAPPLVHAFLASLGGVH